MQRAHAGDLVRRLEHAALELDALEAVKIDHAARLRDDLLRAQAFAPGIGRIGLADVLGVLEEEVGAVGHGVANLPAEQVDDGRADDLALQVEQRDFERADDLRRVLRRVRAGRQFEFDRARARFDRGAHALFHPVQVERRKADHQSLGLLEHPEHGLVAVGLGDADAAIARFQFDDGA